MVIKRYISKSIFKGFKILTFDSEAYRYYDQLKGIENQKLSIGIIYSGNDYYTYHNIREFKEFIQSELDKTDKLMLIAHNMRYDLQLLGLIDYFVNNDEFMFMKKNIKKQMIGSVNYFEFTQGKKKLVFLDSFNFFKHSLKEIAKELGYKKYADEEYNLNPEEWNKYIEKNGLELCKLDCKILYDKMQITINNDKITYGISQASSSFNTWRNKYMPISEINLDKFNDIVEKLYHGGRTELYHLRIPEDSISLDINSLYPYVMKKYKYSVRFHTEHLVKDMPLNLLIENIENQHYNYVLQISYTTELQRTPIMTTTTNGMLCDFQENKNVWITGNEFLELYKSDKNLKFELHRILEFLNMDLYSNFVDDFYSLKKNSKSEAEKSDYKLILNGLYGKNGQRDKKTIFKKYSDIEELEDLKLLKDMQRIEYNGKVYTLYDNFLTYTEDKGYKYASLISAEITANARIVNYQFQKLLGINEVISTDTDSFRITLEYYKNNKEKIDKLISNDLGMLKIEWDKSGIHKGYGLKDYDVIIKNEVTTKRKGIPKKNSEQILNIENLPLEIKNKIEKNNLRFEDIKVFKTKVFKILNNSKDNVEVRDMYKILKYDMVKLRYDDNGYSHIFRNEEEFLKYNKINIIKSDVV